MDCSNNNALKCKFLKCSIKQGEWLQPLDPSITPRLGEGRPWSSCFLLRPR